jgi:hypothetical protein
MRILLGALGFTLLGAALGGGIGFLVALRAGPVTHEQGMEFVNYVQPILFGSIGATFGFILGGGWVAQQVTRAEERQENQKTEAMGE